MTTKAKATIKPETAIIPNEPPKTTRGAKTAAPGNDGPKPENKARKIKMVRDSFTMPEMDYSQLDALKQKCLRAGVHVKKSELLRAGLLSLAKLPDAALVKAVAAVEKLKTGRPAKA